MSSSTEHEQNVEHEYDSIEHEQRHLSCEGVSSMSMTVELESRFASE